MIEEFTEHSETLIEENVHLLAKVYEKLGNLLRKQQKTDEALLYYMKALKLSEEVYPKNSIYAMKMNCFIGDILSRSKNDFK